VTSFKPDIIFIEVDSPTRDTLEQLTTVRERMPRPVVMFCQDQSYQTIESAIQSGVSAYVTDGTDPEHVRPAIATAMATFASFQHLRQELDETKDSLQERKLVERAKGKLMREKGWSEDRAYQVLRKTAMNRKTRLAEVSQAVLAGSLS
jgi:response regulator NasT